MFLRLLVCRPRAIDLSELPVPRGHRCAAQDLAIAHESRSDIVTPKALGPETRCARWGGTVDGEDPDGINGPAAPDPPALAEGLEEPGSPDGLLAPVGSSVPDPGPIEPELVMLRRSVDATRTGLAHWMVLFVGIAIVMIGMAETDRLIASVLDDKGLGHSFSSVIGPLSFTATAAWGAWASAIGLNTSIAWWVVVSVVLDVVYYMCYIGALRRFTRAFATEIDTSRQSILVMIWVLLGAEIVESVVLLAGAAYVGLGTFFMPWIEVVVALLKWGAVAILAVLLLRNEGIRGVIGSALRRGWQAIWFQRLSVIAVVLLVALSTVPGGGVLDQLPDVQRQWIGPAWPQLFWAAGSLVVAFVVAFALGRARTRRAVRKYLGSPERPPMRLRSVVRWWSLPLLAWLGVLLAGLLTGANLAIGWGALGFLAIPVLVLTLSLIFRSAAPGDAGDPEPDPPRGRYAWLTGDLLAVAVITVGGVGLLRSMAIPALLLVENPSDVKPADATFSLILLALGIASALASPFILRWVRYTPGPYERRQIMRRLVASNDPVDPRTPPPAEPDMPQEADEAEKWNAHQRRVYRSIVLAMVPLLAVTLLPAIAATVGPVATTVFAITFWTAGLGAFAVALQENKPLPLFRALQLRATPVLTLGLILPVAYGAVLSALPNLDSTHYIRQSSAEAAPLQEGPSTLESRLAQNTCMLTIGGEQIRPVLLIAAEGGGIRAAYWTGQSMARIVADECLTNSVLVSSGVSGGSVGLSLAGINGDEPIADRLIALASPDTLGTGVSGLMVSDIVASATGIRLPSWMQTPDDFAISDYADDVFGWKWRDRAALIETGWITDVPHLSDAYTSASNPKTGFLLLNSTDVDSGCRVVVGAADLFGVKPTPPPPTADGSAPSDSQCTEATVEPAVSWWLPNSCDMKIDGATAAMLSARFPIVTPAGRLPQAAGCDSRAQLVDGGYAEGSGLGTLADLAPEITETIRRLNTERESDPPYVPIVVYMRNSSGFDITSSVADLTAEPLVPLVAYAAKAKQLTDPAWLQRLSAALQNVCGSELPSPPMPELGKPIDSSADADARRNAASEGCRAAVEATRAQISGQLVVVAPESRPTVVPPLGWALSSFSIASMDTALEEEATCADAPVEKVTSDRPARLCALLALDPSE